MNYHIACFLHEAMFSLTVIYYLAEIYFGAIDSA